MKHRFQSSVRRIHRAALATGLGVLALSTVAFGHGGGMMGGPAYGAGPNASAATAPGDNPNGYGPDAAWGYGMGPGMMWGYGMGPGHMGYGYGPMGGYGPGMMYGYGPRGMWGGHGYGPMWGQSPGWMRGPGYGPGGWHSRGYGYQTPGKRGWGWHANWSALNLSADQQQKIEQIERSHLDKARALRTELYQSMNELKRLMATDNPDATAVGHAFDQVSETRRKLLLNRVDRFDRIQQVLTPSQRKMLQDQNTNTR